MARVGAFGVPFGSSPHPGPLPLKGEGGVYFAFYTHPLLRPLRQRQRLLALRVCDCAFDGGGAEAFAGLVAFVVVHAAEDFAVQAGDVMRMRYAGVLIVLALFGAGD